MIRKLFPNLILPLLLLAQVANLPPLRAQTAGPACGVPAHYLEAANENTAVLLKLRLILSTQPLLATEPEFFGAYYPMLVSTRAYHAQQASSASSGQAGDLPPCAAPINTALLHTIGATQDVLALRLAATLEGSGPRQLQRLRTAVVDLGHAWRELVEAQRAANLQAIDE